jgi:transcriptional regulator of aromatic amino acid metabolism
MKTNDVLNILHKHQEKWITIASNLLYRDDEQAVKDIIQEMYLSIYEQLQEAKLKPQQVIINNKPHYGIIKRTIQQIIQHKANNDNKLPKTDNLVLTNIAEEQKENIEELTTNIEEILQDMYWFDRKLFKLYVKKFNSVRKLAKETKLGHVTVYNTINKCRNNIKKKLNEK